MSSAEPRQSKGRNFNKEVFAFFKFSADPNYLF